MKLYDFLENNIFFKIIGLICALPLMAILIFIKLIIVGFDFFDQLEKGGDEGDNLK
jgi:hypothetical protein